MINEKFQRRFSELEAQFDQLRLTNDEAQQYVPEGMWQRWATSAQNLILAVFGSPSPHYVNFVEAFKNCRGYVYHVNVLKGVFLSAKDDYEGGYVFDIDLQIAGEVFGDFLNLARRALRDGHKDVAAVLACAALEDALKRYAASGGLEVQEKSMQEVVGALKSKGLVSGAQKSLLDAMPKIRDFAMHANWAKLSEPDVSSVIGFVEQLLLSKFNRD